MCIGTRCGKEWGWEAKENLGGEEWMSEWGVTATTLCSNVATSVWPNDWVFLI